MTTIIEATTSAVSTPVPLTDKVGFDPALPLTIAASGLLAGESVTIHFHDGDSWEELYIEGVKAELTSDNKMVTVRSGHKYGVTKTATTNAVKVTASQRYE